MNTAIRMDGGVQSVKEHVQQGADKRAAGELEGARPASNTINRRPKVLIHQRLLEQSSILIISKCSAVFSYCCCIAAVLAGRFPAMLFKGAKVKFKIFVPVQELRCTVRTLGAHKFKRKLRQCVGFVFNNVNAHSFVLRSITEQLYLIGCGFINSRPEGSQKS